MGYEKRIKMSREERAKQFLPFSAVRGLEEALEMKRQELFVDVPHVLLSDAEEEINDTLKSTVKGDVIEVEYFDGVKNTLVKGSVDYIKEKECVISVEGKTIKFEIIGKVEIIETNVVKAISSEKRALALDKGSVGFDSIISISVEE